MMHSKAIIAALVFSVSLLSAPRSVLSNYQIESFDHKMLQTIVEKFEIHQRTRTGFEVYVPANRAAELFQIFPAAKLIEYDSREEIRRAFRHDSQLSQSYHTFAQVQQILKDYSAQHAAIASLIQYGTSTQGNPLVSLRIAGQSVQSSRPQIMITAATHGDELITVEVVLGIIDKLVKGYSTEARIKDIVDNHELFFMPVVNPDGFKTQDRYDNGRDPNRSYPWPQNTGNSPTGSIKPLINFFNSKSISASIDFHAFGEMIMYPWAYTYTSPKTEDEMAFIEVGRNMANSNQYAVGQISKIIYIAPGSSADYYYWKKGSLSYGIEMARSKVPSSTQIEGVLRDNLESTLLFIELVN